MLRSGTGHDAVRRRFRQFREFNQRNISVFCCFRRESALAGCRVSPLRLLATDQPFHVLGELHHHPP